MDTTVAGWGEALWVSITGLSNYLVIQATTGTVADHAQANAQAVMDSVTPQDVNNVANMTGRTAWSVLLSLGLAALASILGRFVNSRPRDTTIVRTA